MKSPFLFLLFLLLSWASVYAQLNESDTVKFQLRASFTGNYQEGNVEVLSLRSKIDFSYSPVKDFVFKSQNSSLYQAFYTKKADNDIFSRNYFYYKPQNKVYPFAIAYISTNYRRKIDSRYFTGAGVTWQLLNNPLNTIKLSAGAVNEQTKFNNTTFNYTAYNGKDKIRLWRATTYIGGWTYLLDKHLRLYYDAYYQPAFTNRINYRTQFDLGMDFFVWKGLSFTTLYTFTHENVVVTGIKREDRILTFGFAYNLKIKNK